VFTLNKCKTFCRYSNIKSFLETIFKLNIKDKKYFDYSLCNFDCDDIYKSIYEAANKKESSIIRIYRYRCL